MWLGSASDWRHGAGVSPSASASANRRRAAGLARRAAGVASGGISSVGWVSRGIAWGSIMVTRHSRGCLAAIGGAMFRDCDLSDYANLVLTSTGKYQLGIFC